MVGPAVRSRGLRFCRRGTRAPDGSRDPAHGHRRAARARRRGQLAARPPARRRRGCAVMSGVALAPCWIPERIVTDDAGHARCRWIDVAGVRFTDPFFDSTVSRRRDPGAERWSTVNELLGEAATVPAVEDVVFIF